MSQLTFRSLHPDDLEAVCDIDSRIVGRSRRGFYEKRLTVATASPETFITSAALQSGHLRGFAFVRLQEGEYGQAGRLAIFDVIGVDPDVQGKGIGSAVLAAIEQRMRKRDVAQLRTEVDWNDHGMTRFFSTSGFSLTAGRILERDTSPLAEPVAEMTSVRMDGQWRVHSGPGGNDYDTLSRDRVLTRSLQEADLDDVVRIDRKLTGRERGDYYQTKFREMLVESGIRVSLVAERDGIITGFIMARVDYGEFGRASQTATLDTIGVHPAEQGTGVGRALLSQLLNNLATLQVEALRTQVAWEEYELRRFLQRCGFNPSQRLLLGKTII
ncbi:hypothetical protein C2E25_04385 [Geothermobacter hydrogeniphilus]|uniref:N-acetyltransferase domain-containing protein n=1 Tax=Geothermobacter hydrogeniphilus TaxID=1969733 RepID=A0A2K2HCQ0_9BACT|nr:GNAT family N-acetyltransferase [Geothermobacter hydrogeniphilus]PNU21044.1 hypothetical protein C2E25_04385 [Geothermobacter hydrogeniphilus]